MFDSKKKVKATTADGLEHKLTETQQRIMEFNRCLLLFYTNQVITVDFWQICPGLNANEMHVPHDRHHKVSSFIKVHQNTPNSVKYEVIWKCQITQSNMKYLLNNTCVQSWT